ncbi:MAG: bifunctional phosphoribosylaminoimidazolecarboxamide formyltransferase/IMP cyclohydrolase [Acidithiobacillus sp.]
MGEIRRALISVSDKRGVVDFARQLREFGVEILSTGGTAIALREAGLDVIDVSDYTGFPELLGGRLKTLHPRIHGGLLARRDDADHQQQMAEQDIPPIDLLCVNLYPFAQTVARPDVTLAQAVEQIDIGGPTMLRAAAKNWEGVTVLVDPEDYPRVLQEMASSQGGVGAKLRLQLATKVFAHTARYDGAIADYLSRQGNDGATASFPQVLTLQLHKVQELRYGENPHQRAAFYREDEATGLAALQQSQGKELSYNNLSDSDAALALIAEFDAPACVIVKHGNPCGVALGDTLHSAIQRAWAADPVSAFGSVVACNRPLDADSAAFFAGVFVEVILAPDLDPSAQELLQGKRNLRLLRIPDIRPWQQPGLDFKRVCGGLLVQDRDIRREPPEEWRVVTRRAPSPQELDDLAFAWTLAHHVRSNAIVYVAQKQSLGIGAGQMSRVDAARCGAEKAKALGFDLRGSVLGSDAFFPFRDGVDTAAAVGVRAIIQPGGSIRDEEVIAAADEADIAMVFTSVRHFRHG